MSEGSTGADALQNSVDLARLAEQLGYTRYWVAEHHGTPMLACASPEVLIAAIGSATSRIRVGSGGVMLPHYSPLKVAETFSMLAALYGDRIDLAVGRAPGSDPVTAFALQRDRRTAAPDDFPEQLAELLAYVQTACRRRIVSRGSRSCREAPSVPTSGCSGRLRRAACGRPTSACPTRLRTSSTRPASRSPRRYRQDFTPSQRNPEPRVMAAIWALCADTDEEARAPRRQQPHGLHAVSAGPLIPVPPVDTALEFIAQHPQERRSAGQRRRWLVGSPATVRPGIESLAAEYGADEVMIVTITHDHAARRRSYELLADAFGL